MHNSQVLVQSMMIQICLHIMNDEELFDLHYALFYNLYSPG